LNHTNDVIACYVTACARMHLYTYLDRLQEKSLYSDSDSVVYVQSRGEPRLVETMTSELLSGHYICEFISAGPKNYAYKTVNTEPGEQRMVCKVRGITLNYSASLLVNSREDLEKR